MCKTPLSREPLQLTSKALGRHLQGVAKELRSGENGKVVGAIEQSIARILVGADGSLTIEAKPGGLRGLEGNPSQVGIEEDPSLLTPTTLSIAGRQWRLIVAGQTSVGAAYR